MIIGSGLVTFVVVIALVLWRDHSVPVAITIAPLPEASIRVSVTGAVATPGVVTVGAGARLGDVAAAAGGFTADADFSGLNLAGRVGDGEHVVIPRLATAGTQEADAGHGTSAIGLLDLNVATSADLEQLPGIGEVLAARIVDYREEHGPYAAVDDLVYVDGISPRLLEELRPLITVGHGG
jgi:competence protein ComEA